MPKRRSRIHFPLPYSNPTWSLYTSTLPFSLKDDGSRSCIMAEACMSDLRRGLDLPSLGRVYPNDMNLLNLTRP